ncbi:hypothetical protein F5Y06DRAFT_58718 [Hypoxylon sp. FL0890]|nr:hypothetical protein F5Y06DRAFT_58718 [Hypoxylon sp. FL0890]
MLNRSRKSLAGLLGLSSAFPSHSSSLSLFIQTRSFESLTSISFESPMTATKKESRQQRRNPSPRLRRSTRHTTTLRTKATLDLQRPGRMLQQIGCSINSYCSVGNDGRIWRQARQANHRQQRSGKRTVTQVNEDSDRNSARDGGLYCCYIG